jgi:FtsX-like permease family
MRYLMGPSTFGVSLVSQRTREIGLRMAIGANQRNIVGLVNRDGRRLVLVGVSLGLAGAMTLTYSLSSLLYGVSATDPITFVMVALSLGGMRRCWPATCQRAGRQRLIPWSRSVASERIPCPQNNSPGHR